MKQIAANLKVKIDNYENISFQLVANQDLNNMLHEYVTTTETMKFPSLTRPFPILWTVMLF